MHVELNYCPFIDLREMTGSFSLPSPTVEGSDSPLLAEEVGWEAVVEEGKARRGELDKELWETSIIYQLQASNRVLLWAFLDTFE